MASKIQKKEIKSKIFSMLAFILIFSFTSCTQVDNELTPESIEVSSTSTKQTQILPTNTVEMSTPSDSNNGITETPNPTIDEIIDKPIEVETSTSMPPTTTETSLERFEPQIVFLGQHLPDDNGYFIGVFDVETNSLEIITEDNSMWLGSPIWSPEKDKVAFTRSDETSSSVQITDPEGTNLTALDLEQDQLTQNNGSDLYLFGWSNDSEWIAYALIHPSTNQDLYLKNVQTKEDVLINNPNSTWFNWSPQNETFTFTDSVNLYTGRIESPNDLMSYQGNGHIGVMNWHPIKNELLVGISDNIAGDLNQLWKLNIDSGIWMEIGDFLELAHYDYSPNGEYIAVHLQNRLQMLNRLLIIEDKTGITIFEAELPNNQFYNLKWVDNSTIGLTAKDNIYIVPIELPTESYWILDDAFFIDNKIATIHSIDW